MERIVKQLILKLLTLRYVCQISNKLQWIMLFISHKLYSILNPYIHFIFMLETVLHGMISHLKYTWYLFYDTRPIIRMNTVYPEFRIIQKFFRLITKQCFGIIANKVGQKISICCATVNHCRCGHE